MSLFRQLKFMWAAGPRESFRQIMRIDEVKGGTLIGTDRYGNQYFENLSEKLNRDRWVIYSRSDYDATQVPPEWHKWLHKLTDANPAHENPTLYRWQVPRHIENMTGTDKAYQPYNTTQPKMQSWQPVAKDRS
ncbi:hypothetical protein H4R34_001295 [Dimargaris verticillata]|uniref:NADH dehydrogenase [ubiquinone] 1 alpha subcomplex subunit n=1 Tax=Dimargaris verticillata TaxID=2761393 RepID=A0A9W8BBQ1_9FUNG|nr:hypothetical protein H4R34_001295 [Dimargaris verticillata]